MWFVIAVVVIFIVCLVLACFIKLRNADIGAQATLVDINVGLTQRTELVPNLVNTVKGYATHERAVFDEAATARAGAAQAAKSGTVDEKSAAQSRLDRAVTDVLAVAEGYPDLTAVATFQQLQTKLSDTQNTLSLARQSYNEAVATLNTLVKTFPWLMLASIAGVNARAFYDAPAGQKAPPQVSF